MPVRLLLDGRKLRDGGIGVYTDNLITGLLEVGGVDITVITGDESLAAASHSSRVSWIFDRARPYSIDELFYLPRRIDFSKFDIFHTPHYVLPYGIPIPTVVTLHDLIHITHPERFYYPLIARTLIRSAARRADAVLAVSRHTMAGVLELVKIPPSKVKHIPNAISPKFSQEGVSGVEAGQSHPYFLAIFSNNKPHKGFSDLLLAYREFRQSKRWEIYLPRCPRLLIAGFGSEDIILSQSGSAKLADIDGVNIVGSLASDLLQAYVKRAVALVVPSLVEGFCLPALEAQAVGTPVVCRPVPALREIVTERDTVAESFSISSLRDALEAGLRQGVSRDREVPSSHLELFSCKNVAAKVKAEYEKLLASRRAR